MKVIYDGDNLHVAAPTLHFLTGKPLERLKYGDVVAYVATTRTAQRSAHHVVRPQKGRFVVSYALWEEKFSVTQLASPPGAGAAHGRRALGGGRRNLVFRQPDHEHRWAWRPTCTTGFAWNCAPAPRAILPTTTRSASVFSDLIDLLGRKNTEVTHWGPLETRVRLADLPRMAGRGSRNG